MNQLTVLVQRVPLVWILSILFVGSLVVGATNTFFITGTSFDLTGDAVHYYNLTVNLLDGNGWQDLIGRKSYLPPLITIELLPSLVIFGAKVEVARWTMVVISSFTAPTLFLVARKITHRSDAAIITSILWIFCPAAVFFSNRVLTESTAALMVVLCTGSFVWAAGCKRNSAAALTGMLWGLMALNRTIFLGFPIILLLSEIVLSRFLVLEWRWSGRQWIIALVFWILVLLPWTARNFVEHEVFMPTSSAIGMGLLITNGNLGHPRVQTGLYHDAEPLELAVLDPAINEIERDRLARELAIKGIRQNWIHVPEAVFMRAINYWTPRANPSDTFITRQDLITIPIYTVVLIFFFSSPFLRSWSRNWPVLIVILFTLGIALASWGTPRFRFPAEPLIFLSAVVGFLALLDWGAKKLKFEGLQPLFSFLTLQSRRGR
ncbi:MAG: hypothetical protein MK384_01900 [SAR202 cluster bacterium]|nr:hypothetical protein [SAR202 cluster bacterium]